jgi:hypothetical protein
MFKPKDTQTTIFKTHFYIPSKLRNRLEESWAEVFRKDIMPIIPEKEFSELYSENMGRPCVALALLIGLSILKEMFDCSDEKFIEVAHEKIILIAETPQEICASIIRLLDDQALSERLAVKGRQLVETSYEWSVIGNKLSGIYKGLAN